MSSGLKALIGLVAAVGMALTGLTTANATDSAVASDPQPDPECTYRFETLPESVNNGFLIKSSGSYRAYADHRLQRATSPGCDPEAWIRTAVNIRCQQYLAHENGWVPTACGATGFVRVQRFLSAAEHVWFDLPYSFASTGSDGITTVYGRWMEIDRCFTYWSDMKVYTMKFTGVTWTDVGFRGQSHSWTNPRCW